MQVYMFWQFSFSHSRYIRIGGCCRGKKVIKVGLVRSWAGAVRPPLWGEGPGGMGGRGSGGCRIHDNISAMWLGKGNNVKTACVQLGRSGRPHNFGGLWRQRL